MAYSRNIIDKLQKYLALRPRSEHEVYNYLKIRNKLDNTETDFLLTQFKALGLISDPDFSEWFVTNRLQFGLHGFNKIKQELKQKGISAELISTTLAAHTGTELESQSEKLADKVTADKAKFGDNFDQKAKQRLLRKYIARGFTYSDLKNLI